MPLVGCHKNRLAWEYSRNRGTAVTLRGLQLDSLPAPPAEAEIPEAVESPKTAPTESASPGGEAGAVSEKSSPDLRSPVKAKGASRDKAATPAASTPAAATTAAVDPLEVAIKAEVSELSREAESKKKVCSLDSSGPWIDSGCACVTLTLPVFCERLLLS